MTAGRPKKYTEKYIEKLGEEMVSYFKRKKEEYFIVSFCAHKEIGKQRISEFAKESAKFSEQLEICKMICESRLAKIGVDDKNSQAINVLKMQHDWREVIHTENKTELTGKGLAELIAKEG